MSISKLAMIVFFIAVGCALQGWLLPITVVVATIAAFVAAVALLLDK